MGRKTKPFSSVGQLLRFLAPGLTLGLILAVAWVPSTAWADRGVLWDYNYALQGTGSGPQNGYYGWAGVSGDIEWHDTGTVYDAAQGAFLSASTAVEDTNGNHVQSGYTTDEYDNLNLFIESDYNGVKNDWYNPVSAGHDFFAQVFDYQKTPDVYEWYTQYGGTLGNGALAYDLSMNASSGGVEAMGESYNANQENVMGNYYLGTNTTGYHGTGPELYLAGSGGWEHWGAVPHGTFVQGASQGSDWNPPYEYAHGVDYVYFRTLSD